jgi:hypothetical protein
MSTYVHYGPNGSSSTVVARGTAPQRHVDLCPLWSERVVFNRSRSWHGARWQLDGTERLETNACKEMLGNLGFGEPRFTGYERHDVVCQRHASKDTRSGFAMVASRGRYLCVPKTWSIA